MEFSVKRRSFVHSDFREHRRHAALDLFGLLCGGQGCPSNRISPLL